MSCGFQQNLFTCFFCDYLSYLCEDGNDCEFEKVKDGISLYMRSTIYCFEVVPIMSAW